MKAALFIIATFTLFVAGLYSRPYLERYGFFEPKYYTQIRQNSSEYKYINPLLFITNTEEKYPELNSLKKMIEKYVSQEVNEGNADNVSVYYREMDAGRWTGVNEDETYEPASMLKVATFIVYLKEVSEDPPILSQKVYYEYIDEPGQYYKPVPLKSGYTSALTLLQQMIIQSDNSAMRLIDQDKIDKIINLYDELELPNPTISEHDFMSPRSYSRFFRALYNSTYLSRSYSEQALKLLTYTNFEKGLKRGIPDHIEVAHKFGEHTLLQDGKLKHRELHDCGIVYNPALPYFLCVMTKGQDFASLEDVIAGISKVVFTYTDNTYGSKITK